MMGRLKSEQGQLFYKFKLDDAVPEDHLVRKIDAALDLSWLRSELAPHYSSTGRPSIDPELMIRMLVVGYVFAIRSERLICREVQVNLAYRWFCKLGIEDTVPDHSAFSRTRNERFREGDVFRRVFERVQPLHCFHDCSDCFRLERLPGGACTHWKAPPLHGAHPKQTRVRQPSRRRRRALQGPA